VPTSQNLTDAETREIDYVVSRRVIYLNDIYAKSEKESTP